MGFLFILLKEIVKKGELLITSVSTFHKIFLKSFLTLPKKALVLTCLQYKSFENTVEKGEIAGDEQFLLFPTVFSTSMENHLPFSSNLELLSAKSFSLEESKICCLGKG